MRWRRSPAFSINRKPVANRNGRSPKNGRLFPPPLPTAVETQAPIQPEAPVEAEAPIQYRPPVEIHAPIEAHGYSRVGPGPMAAIRFRWTVRADNGEYYVDETIGENSNPDRHRPDEPGCRGPDGSRPRSRSTPPLRAVEERDERTRRRRQPDAQGQRRGVVIRRLRLSGRPQKILLDEFDTGVAQDVVGRGDVKEELRHAERQQQ